MKNKLKYSIIFICIIMVLSGCDKSFLNIIYPNNIEIDIPPAPTIYISPLTGRELTDDSLIKLRPIAIMFDNEVSARPQTGLYQADIIYEYPAEGGITRYMGIFLEQLPPVIGAVRSARPYFIDKHFDFNAVYVHCGGSNQAYLDIRDLKVDSINDLKGAPVFNRDKTRRAPHNLYTSGEKLRKYLSDKNLENDQMEETYFKFAEDYIPEKGEIANNFEIQYMKSYKVAYEYKDGLYYRTVNGKPMDDRNDKTQLAVSNVIIENIKMSVLDDEGRLEVTTVGGGTGKLFTGGKVIEINWSKKGRKDKTVYKDSEGNEITVNIGSTYIQGVPKTAAVKIIN